jgi:4-hydroxybenzoate polyprenyltransferase
LLIYPVAVFLLWAYARWFKKMLLVGNLLVAFFCAFVAWVVFYAEQMNDYSRADDQSIAWGRIYMLIVFIAYAFFAFISTLFREIIKDIEDADGDAAEGCRTLPIVFGQLVAKRVALGVGVFFLLATIGLSYFYFSTAVNYLKAAFILLFMSAPILYALFLLLKAKTKTDFAFLSKLAKIIMLSGLVVILLFWL